MGLISFYTGLTGPQKSFIFMILFRVKDFLRYLLVTLPYQSSLDLSWLQMEGFLSLVAMMRDECLIIGCIE